PPARGAGRRAAVALPGAPLGGHRRRRLRADRLAGPGVEGLADLPGADRRRDPGAAGAAPRAVDAAGHHRLVAGSRRHRRAGQAGRRRRRRAAGRGHPEHRRGRHVSEWRRLHPRVIWVDLVRSVLSLLPAVTAIAVFGVDPGAGSLWPLLAVAAAGVLGAAGDAVRWAFTRYRITPSYVERKTGVLVRAHRSIQRDRIRSVDVEGRLRHRLAGLRVVKIGAGQQSAAGE